MAAVIVSRFSLLALRIALTAEVTSRALDPVSSTISNSRSIRAPRIA
jgi:hypothetical protein